MYTLGGEDVYPARLPSLPHPIILISGNIRGPSVQICVGYANNVVTLCRLRCTSGCLADYTLYTM